MKQIPLTKGQFALVDDSDYEWLSKWKWMCVIYKNGNKYARRVITVKNGQAWLHMHREIMHPPDGMDVDHIDGDCLNNQKYNLRVCTRSENHMNRKPYAHKGRKTKGYTYCKKRNVFHAQIIKNKKNTFLGTFKTAEEAARRYDEAASEMFGEYARLNLV